MIWSRLNQSGLGDDNVPTTFVSMRVNWEEEDTSLLESDVDDEVELDIWDDEDLGQRLVDLMKKTDDENSEWLPLS